jgi:hypothetical protein
MSVRPNDSMYDSSLFSLHPILGSYNERMEMNKIKIYNELPHPSLRIASMRKHEMSTTQIYNECETT